MGNPLELAMYDLSQIFLMPVLIAIAALFVYAFVALGSFLWQMRQRRRGEAVGFELVQLHRQQPELGVAELEAVAVERLELARITSRVAPLLGLVATMIPMGPALKGLAEGSLSDVAHGLMIAFSAVILALIAASITFWIVSVRRRWYAQELTRIERGSPKAADAALHADIAAEVPV